MQIAAAALWIKAQQTCREARPARLNLVASNLRLASLPDDDPALVELRLEVERETGIPAALTDTVVHALKDADHLGSLLKFDAAVDQAIEQHEAAAAAPIGVPTQGSLLTGHPPQQQRIALAPNVAKVSLLERLEGFLVRHTGGDDLGLRLRGEQFAVGVRFVRMVREGAYDLVVGNPPYQGTSKMQDAAYVRAYYQKGKADLYAAFLERGLELARLGGTSALLTMRNWMFIKQYVDLRKWLLERFDLRALGDFAIGAFDEVPNDLLSVTASVFRKGPPTPDESIALQPTHPDDRSYDRERTRRKRAATLCYVGRHEFRPVAITRVPGYPVVYWWDRALFDLFESGATTVKKSLRVRQGLATGDDTRFLLRPWEVASRRVLQTAPKVSLRQLALAPHLSWCPYIKGAAGKRWFEPLDHVIRWERNGLHKKLFFDFYGSKGGNGAPSEGDYFQGGLVFSTIGSDFGGRFQRFASIFASTGCTVFGDDLDSVCTLFNSMLARRILASFNPTVHFTNNDVERLPIVHIEDSEQIVEALRDSFGRHESHREPSVEFLQPGPSSWCHIQAWAQAAVDRPEGIRLPAYQPEYDAEPPTDHLSYALGVALGRFGPNGEGILDPANDDLSHGLPAGILFLDGTLDANDLRDGLGHTSAEPLLASWAEHGATIAAGADLRSYLRTKFFSDVHCSMYENRPIHWPLSSEKKTFVAWATIHRWTAETLHVVLADHLYPSLARLEGELADLQAARLGSDKRAAGAAERRFEKGKRSINPI